jgi:hypothetical protein
MGGNTSINSMTSANSPIKLKSTFFFGSHPKPEVDSNQYPYQFMQTTTLKKGDESENILRLNLDKLKSTDSPPRMQKNSSYE